MAPSGNANARRKRPGQPRQPPSNALPRERLPVGTLPPTRNTSITPHITIVSRQSDADANSQQGSERSNTPVRTNPSFLTETDIGLDLHQRESHTDLTRHATFADMARAGLGPDRDRAGIGHMASQEPVSIAHYVKFKKPRHRKGGPSPVNEEIGSSRTPTPKSHHDEPEIVRPILGEPNVGRAVGNVNPKPYHVQGAKPFVPINPIDAQQQHFQLARQTFGELPSLQYLHGNEGQRDGEIQFTIDGGGDISAHMWSASAFQWHDVGLYSYRRKAIEGALGVRQLKGQKIGSVMPRNQLEMFLALAKQYEEESSISTMSSSGVAGYSASAVRARGPPPAVPLVSPRPQRPPISFDTGNDLNQSMSLAAFASQRTRLPTLGSLAAANTATRTGEDCSSFPSVAPQPTPLRDSHSSSSTNNTEVSPLNHRVLLVKPPINTEVDHSKSFFNDYSHLAFLGVHATDDAKQIQLRAWHQEQLRLQQLRGSSRYDNRVDSVSCVETGPRDGKSDPSRQDVIKYGQSSSPFAFGREFGREFANQSALAYNTQPDLPHARPTPRLSAFDKSYAVPVGQGRHRGLSWEDATSSRRRAPTQQASTVGTPASWKAADSGPEKPILEVRSSARAKSSVVQRTESEPRFLSISSIGYSEVDDAWEDRKVPIYGVPASHLFNSQLTAEEPTLLEPPPLRGPFFTAVDDPRNHPIAPAKFKERAEEVWDSLELTSSAREEYMKRQVRALHREAGHIPDEKVVDKMATDPISTLMWGVKLNFNDYKEQEPGAGDYFQRQFKMPKEELIDNTPAGNRSFFESSSSSSEEVVVFKGRTFGSSSQSQGSAMEAPKMPSGQNVGGIMRSMGFEEQMKRRNLGELSSLGRR